MRDQFKITQADVKKLPDGTHRIDEGFYVRIRGGTRSYFFRTQINGERRDITIGSANKLSLMAAKARVLQLRSKIAAGENVFETLEAEKEKKVVMPTFSEFSKEAIEAIANAKRWKNEKHRKQWETTIETYAVPVIGKKKIDRLTRDDVLGVVVPIWETKTETASRVLGRLEKIIDYATFKGLYTKPNPAKWKGNLDMVLPAPSEVKRHDHHEAMTAEEACEVAALAGNTKSIAHKAIIFGLLTACRVSEFLLAKWDEIDLEKRVFSVPPERRKDGRKYPHRVPLSSQAVELLGSIERTSELVFTGIKGGAMSIDTPRILLQRIVGRAVTMHGCRSTFRDWAAEAGKDPILAEKSLMHTTGNEVEQAYQRSDLLEQRRVLMQEWADFLLPSE